MAVELKENTEQSSTPKQQDIQINSVESFLQQKISVLYKSVWVEYNLD